MLYGQPWAGIEAIFLVHYAIGLPTVSLSVIVNLWTWLNRRMVIRGER